jgi:post-segregation antitoxin (ccd killing protein)
MGRLKKITVSVPEDLLESAREDGEGITDTVREALELKARRHAYQRLRQLRGKVKWSIDYKTMKYDR